MNNSSRNLEGWLFDIDDLGTEVALWIYLNDGRLVRVVDRFAVPVYVSGSERVLKSLVSEFERKKFVSTVRWTDKIEFWSGKTIRVLELSLCSSSILPEIRRIAASRDRDLEFFNCDIPAAQYYLYLNQLAPLCKIACEISDSDFLIRARPLQSPWDSVEDVPALRKIQMWGEHMRPLSSRSQILLRSKSAAAELRLSEPATAISRFNDFMERVDPDVIVSEFGDTRLIPALLLAARQSRTEISLDRDPAKVSRKIQTEGRSYFTYGRIVYKGSSYPLFGRWHIDARNSFIFGDTELDGLLELSRLARIPVQRMARTTPGSAMSSMQLYVAVNKGILVPWRKSEPEAFKTALELLTVDKGGLVYQPPIGALEDVAELDYSQMYPTIMVKHNVSPETVLCSCCKNQVVPEANYNICSKRDGLIPLTLKPLLERRTKYKKNIRESPDKMLVHRCNSYQAAIKWMLVSCFGYLGYKNARFGRIEAHESVTAFGREKLLQAKEIAESHGYSVLHAITDSLWIKLNGDPEETLGALCREISDATDIDMSLEGIYKWIVFLPSKVNSDRPVPACYYGVFSDGSIKYRGIACRRSDTPPYIKEVQLELLETVCKANNLNEAQMRAKDAQNLLGDYLDRIRRGEVDPKQLLISRTVTKVEDEYIVNTRAAKAARELRQAGVDTHPGQAVRYIIADAAEKSRIRTEESLDEDGSNPGTDLFGNRIPAYDVGEYVRLLKAAGDEILWPFKSGLQSAHSHEDAK